MIRAAHAGFGVAAILAVASIRFLAAVVAAALSYIDFAADDGLDVALASFIKEIGSSKEIAVIGDGYAGHILAGRFIQENPRLPRPNHRNVISVNVANKEIWLIHRNLLSTDNTTHHMR